LSELYVRRVLDLVDGVSREFNLPSLVILEARDIAKRAISEEVAFGFRPEDVAAVSVYVACRRHRVPLLLREVISAVKSERRRALSLYKRILSYLGISVNIPKPEDHLYYIAPKLNIDRDVIEHAVKLLNEANKTGFSVGKNPRVLAAAALYTAGILANKPMPVKNIASVSKVTTVAVKLLSKRLLELVGFKSI